MNDLRTENAVLEFSEWRAEFQFCEKKSQHLDCRDVGDYFYKIKFPDLVGIKELISKIEPTPNKVTLTYSLSESEISWIRESKLDVSLVIPRMFHQRTDYHLGTYVQKTFGLWTSLVFAIDKNSIFEEKKIKLVSYFMGLPSFGPTNLPVSAVISKKIAEYANLPTRNVMTALVLRAQEFTVFLLIVAMALILDHSAAFWCLALYTVGRSLRAFIPFLSESGYGPNEWMNYGFVFANAIVFVALPFFLLSLGQIKWKMKWLSASLVAAFTAFSVFFLTVENSLFKMDMWSDIGNCFIGIPILLYSIYKIKNNGKKKSAGDGQDLLVDSVKVLRALFLVLVLSLTVWVNYEDLVLEAANSFKDWLDWRHTLILPSLIVAALIEVGSTSKAMLVFSKKMVRQAMVDKDLEMGRQVQQEMLPIRSKTTSEWKWRTYYIPATSLAGDWFDIREINFANGEKALASCLADVTGHGIAAAMMTSTISSHWGRWCTLIVNRNIDPSNSDQSSQLVHEAVTMIHEGLLGLRSNKGCSAAMTLYFPKTQELYYATPGHTGILHMQDHNLSYLVAKGTRLGGVESAISVEKVSLLKGDLVFLYSDGIVAPNQITSQWIKRCHRKSIQAKYSLAKALLNGIRANKKLFRSHPELEDDMTLLIFAIGESQILSNQDEHKEVS
ncbi:MAG: serine/threonine-protein phosphatase [Oligoflexales bacterium]|nr:serine/threonine-protein phosphatase [Oligoflexales bacterium]